jgi:hypothetical protein
LVTEPDNPAFRDTLVEIEECLATSEGAGTERNRETPPAF